MNQDTSMHCARPVTRGGRRVCFWGQSLVRDAAQRAILFEMDRAIMQLGMQLAAHGGAQLRGAEAVVNLTGCYHNLLRTWVEV